MSDNEDVVVGADDVDISDVEGVEPEVVEPEVIETPPTKQPKKKTATKKAVAKKVVAKKATVKKADKPAKKVKEKTDDIPEELGGRWPFRNGSMMLYCFQQAWKGIKASELQKKVEESGYSWKIMYMALTEHPSLPVTVKKSKIHTWKLSEEGGFLKIYDLKIVKKKKATTSE